MIEAPCLCPWTLQMDGSHSKSLPAVAARESTGTLPLSISSTSALGAAFVVLWSTGYVAGKVALVHAGAFNLLVVRFAGATLAFALLAALARVGLPGWRAIMHSGVVGVLSLAVQFGAIYLGVQWGAEIGVAALVVGAMPLVTAALAPWFGERVTARQWIGLALGLGGVLLVLADRLHFGGASVGAYLLLLLGLLGISLGTLYQKRYASNVDARLGLTVQHAVATLVLVPFALHEGLQLDFSPAMNASIAWLIVVNSVGGFGLLFILLRRGAANRVAQLFFLIPPVTAVLSFALFGEQFSLLKLTGFVVAACGVYLGTRTAAVR
jgi:drug/metabolite transporter (DMT)-like permease